MQVPKQLLRTLVALVSGCNRVTPLVLERMDAKAGCLESPEIDEVGARILRDRFAGASVRP
jgi:hypothetical protein